MNSEQVPASSEADFSNLGLHDRLLSQVKKAGFTAPTPIQEAAIPVLLAGKDVLGQAATGTGKTAAFGLPMIDRMLRRDKRDGRPQGVVLVPTRELAMQVADALQRLSPPGTVRTVAIFGGQPMGTQIRALRSGVDLVVGTPGRFLDLLKRGALVCTGVQQLILDEADEMLEMGFAEDLEAIFAHIPSERHTALFSATFPKRIIDIASRHMVDPVRVQMQSKANDTGAAINVAQFAYGVRNHDKPVALLRLLSLQTPTSCIVFCRTRRDVDTLLTHMRRRQHPSDALHGGMSQAERDRVMQRFRGGDVTTLIATDVAARGLDIDHVSHVVNYDLPENPAIYVHRVGRTGRAGRHGIAISLVQPQERRYLSTIERKLHQPIKWMPIPTLADLQNKRLEQASESLQGCLAAPQKGSEGLTKLAQRLAEQFSAEDLARAALQQFLATFADGEDKTEIQSFTDSASPRDRNSRGTAKAAPKARNRARAPGGWKVAQLYVGAGRNAGVRPQDLVGAIANELDLDSRAIGAIEIAPHFSLVEVPDEIIDDIIDGMRRTTIKGRRVTVRRDRESQR